MDVRFDDKVVVVSGAAWGIGRRIVERFCETGARVFCCDLTLERLRDAADPGAEVEALDVTDSAATSHWIGRIEQSAGRAIDVLVNNAGGLAGVGAAPLEEVSDGDWARVLAANATATFVVSRAVVPGMKRARYGRIVNISSGAGVAASRTGIHPYTAAKHAVVGLTRQMAAELGQYGITVNSVAPGFVISNSETRAHWEAHSIEERDAHLRTTFTRRVGEVDDIANPVLFLASGYAAWISGQVWLVDGGR